MATADQPESEMTAPSEPNEPAPAENPPVPADPKALIDRLIAAGEWPEPALIEQIIAAGESTIGPLLEFMRTYPDPKDYKREIVLYHGIGILGEIRAPGTIPELVEIIRRYPGESGAQAAEVLGGFGPEALESILELVREPGLSARARRNAIDAAKGAAGADAALRSRLADVLRPILAEALERARAEAKAQGEEDGEADDDDKGWIVEGVDDEKDLEEEVLEESEEERAAAYETGPGASAGEDDYEPYEELMFLVTDMADLADAQARDLVDTAFREDLIDTFWVDKGSVDESYSKGGEPPRPPRDWLEDYREQYRRHLNPPRIPPIKMEPLYNSSLGSSYPREATESLPEPKVEPVRNTGPKLGRNDPCWCGSGKKYKKCHWGKPGP